MSVGQYLSVAISIGVATAVAGLVLALRRKSWAQRAQNLAAKSDIALPDLLVPKVARFLRDRSLFGLAILWLYEPMLWTAIDDPYRSRREWTGWLPWVVTALPILAASYSYAVTVWPHWKASGPGRVTHFRRLRVRQAFTVPELGLTIVGAVLAASAGGLGLWLAAAPVRWWATFVAATGVALAAWWVSAKAIMGRPSSASDDVELAWDDLIRFSRVRSLTIGAAWLPALCILSVDWFAASKLTTVPQIQSPWPVYVLIAGCVGVYLVYQQGLKLWRQAWTLDGSPQ